MRFSNIPLLLAALLPLMLATPAAAELPDPVRFGVSMEIGDLSAARRWLDEGLDPDFLADRVGTGLMLGAWEGNIPLMELFLQRGAHVNAVNRQGEQALQLAAWKGQIKAVQWLLDHGAAVNRERDEWGALHYAAFAGHSDIVRLLLQRGGNVNARAPNGSTVLMMATHEGQEQLIQPLLDAGADPSLANDKGDTALAWAMRYGHFDIAERVSSPDAFARAARAPLASWGADIRSVAAPDKIGELMRRIRVMEAGGQNAAKLRKALHAAIDDFKKGSTRETVGDRSLPPRALVITAKRQQPGQEKAELVAGNAPSSSKPATASAGATRPGVADLLYQLRQAQAAGQPTDELRQQLIEAVDRLAK